ncbi:unnamed protein product [Amoebophrya sp. A120]|nr:unnamed protein product [Amoebophrya sp. A120]|eukprot:GSA120T00007903001.1
MTMTVDYQYSVNKNYPTYSPTPPPQNTSSSHQMNYNNPGAAAAVATSSSMYNDIEGGQAGGYYGNSSSSMGQSMNHPGYYPNNGFADTNGLNSQNNNFYHPKRKLSLIEQLAMNGTVSPLVPLLGVCFTLCVGVQMFSDNVGLKATLWALFVSIVGMCFSFWLLVWMYRFDEGTEAMQVISDAISEGAEGYFAMQYKTIRNVTLLFSVLLFLLFLGREGGTGPVGPWVMALVTSLTFLVGAGCSALSGYAGMWVSVRANIRVASAARRCYNDALQLCFRGGGFTAVINVSLVVFGICVMMLFFQFFIPELAFAQMPLLLVGYGFGSSLVAMFSQLGGGIYTKGADVGADLVGKVEAGIPEDDPRNPAVIADLVGDNVGDCAGQCADTFESIAAEIMAAMILGGALAEEAKLPANFGVGFVVFPLAVHSMDIVISSVGVMLVRTRRGLPDHGAAPEDALAIMKRAYLVSLLLGVGGFFLLCRLLLYSPVAPDAWKWFCACGVVGLVAAYLFVIITQYYTDYEFSKVRGIAEASLSGPATNVIAGMAVGLESTGAATLVIAGSLCLSYNFGMKSGITSTNGNIAGLFGTAVATMGMLSTAVFVLAMSSFGPIADNAGGIVEMSQQPENVRAITDRLDAVGNVTKANTKGYSVGSAALACFLLFSAFLDEVSLYSGHKFEKVDLAIPEVFVGGLIGSMCVFLFASYAMTAVGKAAQRVVQEVRRQFREIPGILEFRQKPDYRTCVNIVSNTALREMVKPALLAVLAPILVGFVFRHVGQQRGQPLLGAEAVASFMMFSTATGILMALFLNNAGGAWDNAKKYVETGAHGGKNSDAHKAAVCGDTVGDPCKDTAGPSVHVFIKLVSTVTMVVTPLFIDKKSFDVAAGAGAAPIIPGGAGAPPR